MPSQIFPSSIIIDGRAIAAKVQGALSQSISLLKKGGVQPGLAFVRVGEDAASKVYVGRKEKACAELGIFSETYILPENCVENKLLELIGELEQAGIIRTKKLLERGRPRVIELVTDSSCQVQNFPSNA